MKIKKRHLAPRHAMSTDVTRYNNLNVESDGSVTATNGHILIRTERGEPEVPMEPIKGFNLHSEEVKRLVREIGSKQRTGMEVDVEASNEGDKLAGSIDGNRVELQKAVDDDFPDWRKILPTDEPVVEFAIDLGYLADLAKAAKDFGNTVVRVKVREGLVPIEFETEHEGEKLLAFIMPVRLR